MHVHIPAYMFGIPGSRQHDSSVHLLYCHRNHHDVCLTVRCYAALCCPPCPRSAVKVRRVRRYNEWKGYKLTINSTVDAVYNRSSAASAASATSSSSAGSSGSSDKRLNLSLVYAGSPHKATAIEATAEQTTEGAFVAAMNLAAVSTRPLIETQQALAAAAAAQRLQQLQLQLPLLQPSQDLHQVVEQLAGQPLRQLFTKQQQQQQHGGGSSSSSDKGSRAAALSVIQSELLRDLKRMGLLAEAGQATAAAAGQVSREDAARAVDVLQSKVMRDVLLSAEVSQRHSVSWLCCAHSIAQHSTRSRCALSITFSPLSLTALRHMWPVSANR